MSTPEFGGGFRGWSNGTIPCARSWSEQRARRQQNERRIHRQRKVLIREEPERVEEDHEQGGEREGDENACVPRPAPQQRDDAERDPQKLTRVPARRLVEAVRERGVPAPMGQVVEQLGLLAPDRVESRSVVRVAKDEVVLRRRRPDVANAIVRCRDPHVLTGGNRLALRRRRETVRRRRRGRL